MDLLPTLDPQFGTLTRGVCISCNTGTTCYCCKVPRDTSESSPFRRLLSRLSELPSSERDLVCIRFLGQLSCPSEDTNEALKWVPKETDSKCTVDESLVLPLTPPQTPTKATFGQKDVSAMSDSSTKEMDVSFERFMKSVSERDERTLAGKSPNSTLSREEQPVMSYFINFPKDTTPGKVTPRKSAKLVQSSASTPTSRRSCSTKLSLTPRKEVSKQTDTKVDSPKVDKPKRTLPRSGPPPTRTVSCPQLSPTPTTNLPLSPVFSSLQHLSAAKNDQPLECSSESTKLQSPVITWESYDSLKSTRLPLEPTGITFDCPAVISQESTAAVSPQSTVVPLEPTESPKDGCLIM